MPIETLEDLELALTALSDELPRIIQVQTEVASNDIMALVDQRLVETGTDANGAAFVDYTQKYKDKKTALGRFTGKVDFQLTGQMLASTSTGLKNIGVTSSSVSGSTATVVISGRDPETRGKIEGNYKKRPGFLNPSQKEVDRVSAIRSTRIEDMIREEYFT